MRHIRPVVICLASLLLFAPAVQAEERVISEAELVDKATAFWLGQLVGNYLGLPFENNYVEEPLPILVDRIYTYADDEELLINRQDHRGHIPYVAVGLGGMKRGERYLSAFPVAIPRRGAGRDIDMMS